MSAKVEQVYYSERLVTDERKANQKYVNGEIEYIVSNVDHEDDALNAVRNALASKYRGMKLNSLSIDERLDMTTWKVTAQYGYTYGSTNHGDDDTDTPPESTVSFDFATSTRHVERSYETISSKAKAGVAKDYGGIIGVEPDGKSANGVDVLAPVMTFSETHFFKDKSLTTTYKKRLAGLVGKVNDYAWRGYNAGEVLFLGVSGSRNGTDKDDLWQLQFKFAVQLNESDTTIAGIDGISKTGWDYAWVKYKHGTDGTNILPQAEAVYVERVYDRANFEQIGIGF